MTAFVDLRREVAKRDFLIDVAEEILKDAEVRGTPVLTVAEQRQVHRILDATRIGSVPVDETAFIELHAVLFPGPGLRVWR